MDNPHPDLEICDRCQGTGWMSHPDDPAGLCTLCNGKGGFPRTDDPPDDAYDALLDDDDDDWEDPEAFALIQARMPSGWYMFKITDFNDSKLLEIDEWCDLNCRGAYKRVGWRSGCAYSVGMQLENSYDAVHFRLMWSSST